ncbi:MAG TPA: hypothetical protein VL595_30645 [Pseudonocardia sp.]|nr:hypothetical protein [Pseudonocardia sp.]
MPGSVSRPSSGPVDRARRLAEIFGEVLPESTSDDRDPPTADRRDDSWYTENRPPHHDAR